jgi:hypothetical protein
MAASSEANSLESWFALGKQSAKGTPATALFKALATVSALGATYDEREAPLEHPAVASRATARKVNTKRTSYMSNAKVTGILHPKFIVPLFLAAGFQAVTTNNTTHYTHVLTLGSSLLHKWMTAAWNVESTDGAFVNRGSDMRATSLNLAIDPEQIEYSAELRGLVLAAMSGSPTYTGENPAEIVPWLMTRTTMTMNATSISERIRSMEFAVENTLREDDRAVGEAVRVNLAQQNIDISMALGEINISAALYNTFHFGSAAGTSVVLAGVSGALDIKFAAESNIAGAPVPESLQIAIPSLGYTMDGEPEASGDDLITLDLTAYMIDDSATPITVTVVNNVASY